MQPIRVDADTPLHSTFNARQNHIIKVDMPVEGRQPQNDALTDQDRPGENQHLDGEHHDEDMEDI
jgi:hypothetical protein